VFIQVIQGRCTRQDELRALAQGWRTEVGTEAPGFLGGTFGFTDDDQFIGVVRFESQDAARANSERPEQAAWAEKMSALMDGTPEYHDCDDVTTFLDGGSDDAGFVQVIRGRVEDRDRVKALLADTDELRRMRPEIIGGTLAFEDDGSFTQTVAFTDEASARRGEQTEPPPEMREAIEALMRGATFYDLRDPWFESPS
jgi:hypothetical protein